MNKLLLLAGAAAMLGAAPAIAEKGGKGAKVQAAKQVAKSPAKASGKARAEAARLKGARVLRDRDRDGIDDRDEALARKYGGALCPPGLAKAKRDVQCMPPGQAKRPFRDGQRLPSSYRQYTPFDDIPTVLRDRYDLDARDRYIYRDNVIYVVDPQTRLIRNIIDAVL